jgi:methylated-DNA-[protein]-cysteine S-methyltransferase
MPQIDMISNQHVTPHQWAVYDYVRTIPCGKVTTYKDIATALNEGSPRSVGGALRNNPFAPFVPCHRIVASNLFVGGFCGEWGVGGETDSHGRRKVEMLAKEGVAFTKDGYLRDREVVWRG